MSRNYFVGLVMAVSFLVVANVKADIDSVTQNPDPDGIYGKLFELNLWAFQDDWYPNDSEIATAKKLGWDVSYGRYTEDGLNGNSKSGDFWVTVTGSPLAYATLTGTQGPWQVFVNGEWEWAGSNYWGATGADAMYFQWDGDTFTLSFRDIYGTYDGGWNNQGGIVWTQPFTLAFYGEDPATTPEPATLAVLGLGLAGLGIARRRMKK